MDNIAKALDKIGSRATFGQIPPKATGRSIFGSMEDGEQSHLMVDIDKDHRGEFFRIDTGGSVSMPVMKLDTKTNHLLLFAQDNFGAKYRFMCGKDERGWFAAGGMVLYPCSRP